ncbi:MAG TPA: LD-carboxypeptidase [Vicinamibacterales bacterium]
MRKPRALRAGDRVAIVAPSSGCSIQELDGGVAELRRLGFDPVHTGAVAERDLFTAGSVEVRARDFLTAWTDPSIAALVALRGGYGSAQLLPHLDPAVVARTPKLLVGYSDTTALLSWLTCQVGVTALHGPMVDRRLSRGPEGYDVESFLALSRGDAGMVLPCPDATVVRGGEAQGPLLGGTLTQLVASLGTPYAFAPPDGCILFIEDVDERPYRVHRMLTQLAQAGVLGRARGLVFGEMRGCDEPGGGPTAVDAIRHALEAFAGPVFCGFPSGHTMGPLVTLPLGSTVRVATHPRAVVVVEESPVA